MPIRGSDDYNGWGNLYKNLCYKNLNRNPTKRLLNNNIPSNKTEYIENKMTYQREKESMNRASSQKQNFHVENENNPKILVTGMVKKEKPINNKNNPDNNNKNNNTISNDNNNGHNNNSNEPNNIRTKNLDTQNFTLRVSQTPTPTTYPNPNPTVKEKPKNRVTKINASKTPDSNTQEETSKSTRTPSPTTDANPNRNPSNPRTPDTIRTHSPNLQLRVRTKTPSLDTIEAIEPKPNQRSTQPHKENQFSTFNLSNYEIKPEELTLLEKGLTFAPAVRKWPVKNVLQSRDQLIRRLKLKAYFDTKKHEKTMLPEKTAFKRKFIEKSTFTPADNEIDQNTTEIVNKIMDATENFLKQNLCKDNPAFLCIPEKDNLSAKERAALKNLKKTPDIIIKKSDKGNSIVVMNKKDYIQEAETQLNDLKYYRKVETPLFTESIPEIKLILQDMLKEKIISKKQFNFFTDLSDLKSRTFYILPKIHKKPETWKNTKMPPGRPIVSNINSETYKISQLIEHFLSPLANKHPSYIKNSYDFIEKIQKFQLDQEYILLTGDVASLYTNMDQDLTLKCITEIFKQNPNPNRPDKYLIQLLEICLKNSDFEFNNKFYIQTCGTAMGFSSAPPIASIFLILFDKMALQGFDIKPPLFYRYLDDCFTLWPKNQIHRLTEYESFLNNLIPNIKITFETNEKQIDFLDTTVYFENNRLLTRVHFKDTDTHQLLHRHSFHPKHMFENIVKSQLIRFKRLSSTVENYNETCKILFNTLKNRGYTMSKLRKQQKDIWYNYQSNTTKNHPENKMNNKKDLIPISLEYSSIATKLSNQYKAILKDWKLSSSVQIVTAFKKHKNLKDILVRSHLTNTDDFEGFTIKCNNTRCNTCKFHFVESKTFRSSRNLKAVFKIQHKLYCHSENVVYLITCAHCQLQYVGETSRSLRDRVNDHRSAIKLKKETPIATHFNTPGHKLEHLKIIPIIKITENNTAYRQFLERKYQKILRTIHPEGINCSFGK